MPISLRRKPKEEQPPREIVDDYDILMAKFERDLGGSFPFAAFWPQPEESGGLVKVLGIINAILLVIILIVVIAK